MRKNTNLTRRGHFCFCESLKEKLREKRWTRIVDLEKRVSGLGIGLLPL